MENLAGPGYRYETDSNPPRGLHPPLSDPAKTHQNPHSHKLLCQSSQEQLPVRGIASAYREKCCRTGLQSDLVRVLQPTLFSPKTQQQVETDIRPEQSKSIPQAGEIQNGDTGNHQDIPATGRMGYLGRLQRCLLPYTDTGTVQEIPQISCPIKALPFGLSTAPMEFTVVAKEVGHTQGYKDPPVPRRLVGKSQIPPNLSPTYPTASQDVPGSRLVGEYGKIRTGTQASL